MKRFKQLISFLVAIIAFSGLFAWNFSYQFKDQSFPSAKSTFNQLFKRKNASIEYASSRLVHMNTHPSTFVVVDSLLSPEHPLNIQRLRNEEGAMDLVDDEAELDNLMPWSYYSPRVSINSEQSYARQRRLMDSEPFNGYKWYEEEGDTYLYQEDTPYSGWYSRNMEQWEFYEDGKKQEDLTFYAPAIQWPQGRKSLIAQQTLRPPARSLLFDTTMDYQTLFKRAERDYNIMLTDPNLFILTAPPGAYESRVVATSQHYLNSPLGVIEEVETPNGDWLLVESGYQTVGWVKKDLTGATYEETDFSERELLNAIYEVVAEEIENIPAIVGASFINNETMAQIDINNQTFFPASTQKIYALAELYHQYKTEELAPEDILVLTDADRVPGAGIIQDYATGYEFTLDELVDLVAIYSDNIAANMIIDVVGGGERITPHMHQLGFYDTYVNKKYYSYENELFISSPHDAARFFAMLYNNQINGAPWDEMLIAKLTMNTHNFLRSTVPVQAWNKSGLGETEQNDVATFVTPYGSYSLAVFTAEPDWYDGIPAQLGQLSRRVYDTYINYYVGY